MSPFSPASAALGAVLACLSAAFSASAERGDAVVALGEKLFFAKSLSADRRISCASCHEADHAFAGTLPRAVGTGGAEGSRNAPSLLDSARRHDLFWDGRRDGLEELVLDPLLSPREHGLKNAAELEQRVADDATLQSAYARAFGSDVPIDASRVAQALTTFVATLHAAPSALDRYLSRDESTAMNAQQVIGYELFRGRAGCVACHRIDGASTTAAALSDDGFHNQGIGADLLKQNLQMTVARGIALKPEELGPAIQDDARIAALGRFLVSHQPADIGAFRTPSLRNVAITAPYMHDGSIATLREAVDHELYYSATDRGAGFGHEEREALVEFLRALSSN